MRVQKYKTVELDTGAEIEGFYYCENGYVMNGDKPDFNQPVQRHYIVDGDGRHREAVEWLLEPAGFFELNTTPTQE